jgi:hypothetical protein
MLGRVVRQIFTDVQEELTASIISVAQDRVKAGLF